MNNKLHKEEFKATEESKLIGELHDRISDKFAEAINSNEKTLTIELSLLDAVTLQVGLVAKDAINKIKEEYLNHPKKNKKTIDSH